MYHIIHRLRISLGIAPKDSLVSRHFWLSKGDPTHTRTETHIMQATIEHDPATSIGGAQGWFRKLFSVDGALTFIGGKVRREWNVWRCERG